MTTERPDLYAILGLAPSATQAEISHAYRSLLRQHHPDTRAPSTNHKTPSPTRRCNKSLPPTQCYETPLGEPNTTAKSGHAPIRPGDPNSRRSDTARPAGHPSRRVRSSGTAPPTRPRHNEP